jgi:hypothetical protein
MKLCLFFEEGVAMKKKNMSRFDLVRLSSTWYDLVVCLILIGISAWFLMKSRELEMESASGSIGPATFPATISVLLIIASTSLVLPSLKGLLQHKPVQPITFRRPVFVLLAVILFAVFPFAMQTFGYFPAAAVWLIFFGLIAGTRKFLQLCGLVIGFLIFAWVVFDKFLGTPL